METFPAVERLKEYAAAARFPELAGYPEPVALACQKLQQLMENGQVAGARMALKDLYEVALKTVILTAAAEVYQDFAHRTPERNQFLQVLFVKSPAFGYWKQTVGGTLLRLYKKENRGQEMPAAGRILDDLLWVMEKNQIVAWRNQDAHGSAHDLQDVGAVTELARKWEALAEHLTRMGMAYQELPFGDLEMYPFVIWEEGQCYFFDSFLYEKERIVFLDYQSSRRIQMMISSMQAFCERFQMQPAELHGLADVENDELTDREMEQLSREKRLSHLKRPDYLVNWLQESLDFATRGYFLLQMERGMGKSTFARMLDPMGETGVKLPGFREITIRRYHMTPFYNRQSVVSFARELEHQFSHENQGGQVVRVFGGSGEGRIHLSESLSDIRQSLADFLNQMRSMHEKRFGCEKLLLVLDGADEVMTEAQQAQGMLQILDILPQPAQLDHGVYILLLSRTDKETAPYQLWRRVREKWDQADQIKYLPGRQAVYVASDEGYRQVVYEYIRDLVFAVLEPEEVQRFLQSGAWNFVFAAAAAELIRLNNLSEPAELRAFLAEIRGLEDLFDRYMTQMQFIYGQGYFEELRDVLLGLSIRPEGKTLSALANQRGEGGITYRLAGMVQDLSPFVKEERDGRESRYACSNLLVREVVMARYAANVEAMLVRELEDWLGEPLPESMEEKDAESRAMAERRDMLIQVPFQEAQMRRAAKKIRVLIVQDGVFHYNYLEHLQVLAGRYQEADLPFPEAEYLQSCQLRYATNIYEYNIGHYIRMIEQVEGEGRDEMLKSFWAAYEKQLSRARGTMRRAKENRELSEAQFLEKFYWQEIGGFARIWQPISDAFYPGLTARGAGFLRQTVEFEDITRARMQGDWVSRALSQWAEEPGLLGQMFRLYRVMFMEEQLLYCYLLAGYYRLAGGKEKCDYAAGLEDEGSWRAVDLWYEYAEYPGVTELWRDAMDWTVPVWVEERIAGKETRSLLAYLANLTGCTEKEFLEAVHKAEMPHLGKGTVVCQRLPLKEALSDSVALKDKLLAALDAKQSDRFWVYMQIVSDYVAGLHKKQAAYSYAMYIGGMLYPTIEGKDYENYLRCFKSLTELWPQLSWFQKRKMQKKFNLQKSLPAMTETAVFKLGQEWYAQRNKQTEKVLYRNLLWYDLDPARAEELVKTYAGREKTAWLEYIRLAQRMPIKMAGYEVKMSGSNQALNAALNRECCQYFWEELWKIVDRPKKEEKDWGWMLEMFCACEPEALADCQVSLQLPDSFARWEEKMQADLQKDSRNSLVDECFYHAAVFERMADPWGRERCAAAWDAYLSAQIRKMADWNWNGVEQLRQKQWISRLVFKKRVQEELMVSEAARQRELGQVARLLLPTFKQKNRSFREIGPIFLWIWTELGGVSETTVRNLELSWEPDVLLVGLWYQLDALNKARNRASTVHERDLIYEALERTLAQGQSLRALSSEFLRFLMDDILTIMMTDRWDEGRFERWIMQMIPAIVRRMEEEAAGQGFSLGRLCQHYLTVGYQSFHQLRVSFAACAWPASDAENETWWVGWARDEHRMKAYQVVCGFFQKALKQEGTRLGVSGEWKEREPVYWTYEDALAFLEQESSKTSDKNLAYAVDAIRRSAAWLAVQGEREKACKLYENILLMAQSCQRMDFLEPAMKDHRELVDYLWREPHLASTSSEIFGYYATSIEYIRLLQQEPGQEEQIYEVGAKVLQHIQWMKKTATRSAEEIHLTDPERGYLMLLHLVDQAAEIIGKTDEWAEKKRYW